MYFKYTQKILPCQTTELSHSESEGWKREQSSL